uniref:Uncharacterized protein n=1 Tax=Rhizophora mucronata TaxID=61149 RepID=A0A2P2MX91_RHIMU
MKSLTTNYRALGNRETDNFSSRKTETSNAALPSDCFLQWLY